MQKKLKVLLTGASGFVGRELKAVFESVGHDVLASYRRAGVANSLVIDSIDGRTEWGAALAGIDCVVHSAGRAHVMNETASDPLEAFRQVNTEGTLNLARQAAAAGVSRFVFISSIKVNGESTKLDKPFTETVEQIPCDPYGLSKYEAEQGLKLIAAETNLEVVIVRPVLVYGPGVKANFLSMMKWIRKGIPLPLGAIHNQRSLVSLDNLVDFVMLCCTHERAANETFLISDDSDLSTTDMLKKLGVALGVRARLIPVSMSLISAMAKIIGKGDLSSRICGSLSVDVSHAKKQLGWEPAVTVDTAFEKTAADFVQTLESNKA